MGRTAYVNGRYVPHGEAAVHIEDRGYQFADGVYEVYEIWQGCIIDQTAHLDRLERSLSELSIAEPMHRRALQVVLREVARRNKVRNGFVYIQVTRGVAPRDHGFPKKSTQPALVITAKPVDPSKAEKLAEDGIAIISLPENRWPRVDIKSVSLLPNVLAKQHARDSGAHEAWFVDKDGYVTEGASTNAWIVTSDGTLVTRPAAAAILRGITRSTLIALAKSTGVNVEERGFTISEAQQAREAFVTAASTLVMPVVTIDNIAVANGKPGVVALELRRLFHTQCEKTPL